MTDPTTDRATRALERIADALERIALRDDLTAEAIGSLTKPARRQWRDAR